MSAKRLEFLKIPYGPFGFASGRFATYLSSPKLCMHEIDEALDFPVVVLFAFHSGRPGPGPFARYYEQRAKA